MVEINLLFYFIQDRDGQWDEKIEAQIEAYHGLVQISLQRKEAVSAESRWRKLCDNCEK